MNYTPLDVSSLTGTKEEHRRSFSLPRIFTPKTVTALIGATLSLFMVYVGFTAVQSTYTKANDSAPRDITANVLSPNSARIAWSTDQESQAVVMYGTTAEILDQLAPEKEPSKTHVIQFGGMDTNDMKLAENTKYYFTIKIGDKIYDDNGKPWTFTTENPPTPTQSLTPDAPRPTQSMRAFSEPTALPIPTLETLTCGSRSCVEICKKLGTSCSSMDWARSGCSGKVSLTGCTEIVPTKRIEPTRKVSPTAVPTKRIEHYPTKAPTTTVPTTHALPTTGVAQVLKKPSDIETLTPATSEHYRLYTDSTREQAEKYLKFFEAFRSYFSVNFFDASSTPVVTVYLFSNPNDFMAYSVGKAESNYGFYMYTKHILVTHSQAGYGTYAHELAHSFIDSKLSVYPGWLSEGLPTFFEKIIGYFDNKSLKLLVGFQNPWRVQEYIAGLSSGKAHKPTLLSTVRWPVADYSENAHDMERFLSLYLFKRGWLKGYVAKLVQNPSQDQNAEYIMAVSGKSLSDLEADYSNWLDEVKADGISAQSTLPLIPASFVLQDKTEWDHWLNEHREDLLRIGVRTD